MSWWRRRLIMRPVVTDGLGRRGWPQWRENLSSLQHMSLSAILPAACYRFALRLKTMRGIPHSRVPPCLSIAVVSSCLWC
ncbi:protein of unknown function [Cupriavidus taiwanensis]|uniref:Uncharacterized protein n=1 Tax=Cupriavidus taiwanensis TaxID=164546 RepID=A0A375I8F9_9BURK|nr:hypothetical protein CBM2588_A180170 [Cupriavidus taiwanensis]SOY50742.1 hypothetical protein CBM2592_A230021 [Cupriavidus taiwanensis]SOY83679.1 hypothetical protein CBM2591_A270031 [Cupriavidus taiwanensis]SOZ23563.1 hypothetical protein CBM2608_A280014 [Cupriavidus taiwanensis]SOZ57859.1 hypothetical protein CBM2617_A260022 [Cupriavidus taiwanensis]